MDIPTNLVASGFYDAAFLYAHGAIHSRGSGSEELRAEINHSVRLLTQLNSEEQAAGVILALADLAGALATLAAAYADDSPTIKPCAVLGALREQWGCGPMEPHGAEGES